METNFYEVQKFDISREKKVNPACLHDITITVMRFLHGFGGYLLFHRG